VPGGQPRMCRAAPMASRSVSYGLLTGHCPG
jgi:hypothetical protein